MRSLKSFLFLSVMCAGAVIGKAQNQEVRFRYLTSGGNMYLSEIPNSSPPQFDVMSATPATFCLDAVSPDSYLIIAGTPETSGEYVKGRFMFDDTDYYYHFGSHYAPASANCYISNGGYGTGFPSAVTAVRKGNLLYVLGSEQVTDYSQLDGLVQSGTVKKIDLTQENNFTFNFNKSYSQTSGIFLGYTIQSKDGFVIIQDHDRKARMEGFGDGAIRSYLFIIESDNGFVPGESEKGGQLGENDALTWELIDGTLTVSGTGAIPDWASGTSAPWFPYFYAGSITGIVIESGITAIGKSSFSYTTEAVASVVIPESVKSIGESAFSNAPRSVSVNWTKAEDLPSLGASVFTYISPDAVLHVPAGTKAVYEAANVWKNFKTIKEQGVTAQPEPIRNSRGSFNISLTVPESGAFTAGFDVVLPAKFALNIDATKLVSGLENGFDLEITAKDDNVWSFAISPKATRNASANPFREVVNVVYSVEKTLANGNYELKVKALELKLADGTEIREDEIIIPVTFNSTTGNAVAATGETLVWSYGGNLHVSTPTAARLSIYTLTGALQKQQTLAAGETVIALPAGIYIIKIGDTVQKIFVQ